MDQTINQIIQIMVAAGVSLILYSLIYVLSHIARKLKLEKAGIAKNLINHVIATIVSALNQEKVSEYKRLYGGKLTKADTVNVKNEARRRIECNLDKKLKKDVKPIVKNLEQYCDNMIEHEVRVQKIKVDVKDNLEKK